jgi:hypothetical protein
MMRTQNSPTKLAHPVSGRSGRVAELVLMQEVTTLEAGSSTGRATDS